ncbi:hypothetical protein PMSD_18400 [Paenibacillus macquariensis subsp. defensor]|nr:hypothetical protein PMSD_18400 [Paenibacillus macquariensis subsp. defensor]
MAYKVINRFMENEDNGTIYSVGESYPKGSFKPTKKRISELSKVHPKYNVTFIEEVKEQQEE